MQAAPLFVECPECDGWGFETVLSSQWEESEDSPIICFFCQGLGMILLPD